MQTTTVKKREEIDAKDKWRLEDIYENNELWEADLKKVSQLAEKAATYEGKLAQSGAMLLEGLTARDEMDSLAEKLFVYARMRRDEDNANSTYQSMVDRCSMVFTQIFAAIAFFLPELTEISPEKLDAFMKEAPGLEPYRFTFEKIQHNKEHVLSPKEETLMAQVGEISDAGGDIFGMFNDADIKFGTVKDEEGKEVTLTKGSYMTMMDCKDRRVRKDAFDTLYKTYESMRNTLAAMYGANVKSDKFYATVRKYNSALEASLHGNNIDVSVYDNLIATINANLPKLDEYLKVRKRALGLDELHMYDLYVPMVSEVEKKYTFEEAKEIVLKALAPLGEQYVADVRAAFDSGWIDVYENEGKTGGAYAWGCYKTHPYVLLNFQGTIDSVFTLAHEMGHAMHTFYSNKKQHYATSTYTLFVAEVASTVNETLLIQYMLQHTEDKKERAYLLNHYLEEFRGTVFRQVMFAEFEKLTHAKVEGGEALTTDWLCETYYGLNEKYFGRQVCVDKAIAIEWARIPHFYRSFYVYQYATGFSAATALATAVLKEGAPAVERYLAFLASGGSKYPLDLLKDAGVDLSTPAAVEAGLERFGEMVTELNTLV